MSFIFKVTVSVLLVSQLGCGKTQFSASKQATADKLSVSAAATPPLSCGDLTDDQIIARQVQRIQDVIQQLSSDKAHEIEHAERFIQALLNDTSVRRTVIEQERLFCEKGPLCPLGTPDGTVLIPCSENPHALDALRTSVPQ